MPKFIKLEVMTEIRYLESKPYTLFLNPESIVTISESDIGYCRISATNGESYKICMQYDKLLALLSKEEDDEPEK